MQFDLKRITLGNILSIVAVVSSVFLAYSKINADIDVIKNDIKWIKISIDNNKKLVTRY